MIDIKFLRQIEDTITAQEPVPDPVRIRIEQARANLEAGRMELLAMVRHHDITRKQFNEQIALLEQELRVNEALLPATAPAMDIKDVLKRVAIAFREFRLLRFPAKREMLRGAVRRIVTDSRARTLTSITICGGYLDGANGSVSLKTQWNIRPTPDITIHLPEPFEIPELYADRRAGNGQHPNQIANRFRGRLE